MRCLIIVLVSLLCFSQAQASDPPRAADTDWIWSFALPGFGQWKTHQYGAAAAYSGIGAAGITYGIINLASPSGETFQGIDRDAAIGLQAYQTSASLSSLHAFHDYVETPTGQDEYPFLSEKESQLEVLTAPLRFDFLIRPTTFIPLAGVSFLFFKVLPASHENVRFNRLTMGDTAFLSGASYMAGVGEESVFRGVLMPYLMHHINHDLTANALTATIFALAHVSLDPEQFYVPWPQFLGGLYFGWLSQHRNWTIAEAIFVHTWYDVLAFSAEYATGSNKRGYLPITSFSVAF